MLAAQHRQRAFPGRTFLKIGRFQKHAQALHRISGSRIPHPHHHPGGPTCGTVPARPRIQGVSNKPIASDRLFAPLTEKDETLGSLVETGIFAQRFHRLGEQVHYARWKSGSTDYELDLVELDPAMRAREAVEIKYTDRVVRQTGTWEPWIRFLPREPAGCAYDHDQNPRRIRRGRWSENPF
jgi:hypothetical protein